MRRERPGYRAISDYGVIGDCESAALVASDGGVDWWCPFRFDSPSVFAAILDRTRGGFFRVHVEGAESHMAYVPRTNVLQTKFHTPAGTLDLLDFMPLQPTATRGPRAPSAAPRLVRVARCTRGEADAEVAFVPRFDYGRVTPKVADLNGRFLARGEGEGLILDAPMDLRSEGDAVAGSLRLRAGDSVGFTLTAVPYEVDSGVSLPDSMEPEALLARTRSYWETWAGRHAYDGRYRETALRSALILKLLTYAPTGAVVAAPTMSLPECVGGVRNWDYRYAWIRDSVFAVRALHMAGHDEEVEPFIDWLVRVASRDPSDLRVLYGVAGERDLAEREVPHLEGYRGSRPVRVGNAASEQFQLDVYGELMHVLHECTAFNRCDLDGMRWPYFRKLADFVSGNWRRPDSGIWEFRSEPMHFVLSKAMAWVALDRAIHAVEEGGFIGDVDRWRAEARACREECLERGWSDELNAFKQAYESPVLDAANLLLPIIGFIDARDPRMVATTEAIQKRITLDDLVYRYIEGDDGLPGEEASFAYCTFWLVEVLALQGKVKDARRVFERMIERASPLGLFAEEIDPRTGEHLGNYPQGFPHIGLITAAVALERAERQHALADPLGPRPAQAP